MHNLLIFRKKSLYFSLPNLRGAISPNCAPAFYRLERRADGHIDRSQPRFHQPAHSLALQAGQ